MKAKLQIMMLRRVLGLATLPSLAIVLYICFILFSIRVKSPFLSSSNTTILVTKPPHLTARFSLLIGILTQADKYDHRHFLRLVYGIQSSPLANIDVKFVFCNITKPEQWVLVAFSSLLRILRCRHDYVMRADDDVFLRLAPLALLLQPLQRLNLYYVFVIPCDSMNPFVDYMSGKGFIMKKT